LAVGACAAAAAAAAAESAASATASIVHHIADAIAARSTIVGDTTIIPPSCGSRTTANTQCNGDTVINNKAVSARVA
jgi:hypothetical protein